MFFRHWFDLVVEGSWRPGERGRDRPSVGAKQRRLPLLLTILPGRVRFFPLPCRRNHDFPGPFCLENGTSQHGARASFPHSKAYTLSLLRTAATFFCPQATAPFPENRAAHVFLVPPVPPGRRKLLRTHHTLSPPAPLEAGASSLHMHSGSKGKPRTLPAITTEDGPHPSPPTRPHPPIPDRTSPNHSLLVEPDQAGEVEAHVV